MPTIPPQQHQTYHEWLFLEPDGRLSTAQQAELERHLEACVDCRSERKAIARLGQVLDSRRVEADPDLYRRVMENLPPAGWEASNPKAWRWAVAVLVVLVGATFLAGRGIGVEASSPFVGTVAAVFELFSATAVAGAGLLAASWQGIGLALDEIFGGSKLTLGVFAFFVLGIDVLFVRMLLRAPHTRLASGELARSEESASNSKHRR